MENSVAKKNQTPKLEHEDVVVSFSRLHFDPVNPRGEPELDEEKIRELFGSQPETLKLATHIAEHGLNPLERIGIVTHTKLPGHFIIREGNRRLCAMQLLRDPNRAPNDSMRKAYSKLTSSGRSIPDTINAVLFRATGNERIWMSVKHEGPQGGLGTLSWGPSEKTRFNREGETGKTRPKNPNRQAEALLTYAVDQGLIKPEERQLISLTTLTRYLPNVRTALALLNTEDCTTDARSDEFQSVLKRFLTDALNPSTPGHTAPVNSRSTSAQRNQYAENLRREGVSPINRDQTPYDPSKAAPTRHRAADSPRQKGAKDPGKRKQLIPSSFTVSVKDNVLLRLVREGKDLNPDEARFSCNYINRVILEHVVHMYAKKRGIGKEGDFSDVVRRVVEHAKKSADPPGRGIVNVLNKTADKRSSYSYEIMSNPIHGGSIPSGADNRVNWETLQPALEYLLSNLK